MKLTQYNIQHSQDVYFIFSLSFFKAGIKSMVQIDIYCAAFKMSIHCAEFRNEHALRSILKLAYIVQHLKMRRFQKPFLPMWVSKMLTFGVNGYRSLSAYNDEGKIMY